MWKKTRSSQVWPLVTKRIICTKHLYSAQFDLNCVNYHVLKLMIKILFAQEPEA